VRLSPLVTAAIVWPIVPAPHDGWWWLWSNRWNPNWQGKLKYSEKTCLSVTLCTTNPTYPGLGSNPDRLGGKPATNRLSYGTAYFLLSKMYSLHSLLTILVTRTHQVNNNAATRAGWWVYVGHIRV
jgi:hypothetical protein